MMDELAEAAKAFVGLVRIFVKEKGKAAHETTERDWDTELRCTCLDQEAVLPRANLRPVKKPTQ